LERLSTGLLTNPHRKKSKKKRRELNQKGNREKILILRKNCFRQGSITFSDFTESIGKMLSRIKEGKEEEEQ